MHEMSLAEGIRGIVEDAARSGGFKQVRTVVLEIGALSTVEVEALRFCFDAVMRDTVAEGAQMEVIAQAAELASNEGIDCDVIDLRSILPWDIDTVVQSVQKTGRLIVSHEAPVTNGFGAEIAATVQEQAFLSLESPILRVCGLDTPYPLSHETEYMPDASKIFEAIKRSVNY